MYFAACICLFIRSALSSVADASSAAPGAAAAMRLLWDSDMNSLVWRITGAVLVASARDPATLGSVDAAGPLVEPVDVLGVGLPGVVPIIWETMLSTNR